MTQPPGRRALINNADSQKKAGLPANAWVRGSCPANRSHIMEGEFNGSSLPGIPFPSSTSGPSIMMKFVEYSFSKTLAEPTESGGAGQSQIMMSGDTPILVRDAFGEPYAALMVEHAELRGSTLTLNGWCIGDCMPIVRRQEARLHCEVKRSPRPDVVQLIGITPPPAGPGFEIQAYNADATCHLLWIVVRDGEAQEIEVDLKIFVAAQAETLATEAPESTTEAEDASSADPDFAKVVFDRFVGAKACGWSVDRDGNACGRLAISFGGRALGHVNTSVPRVDVQEALGLSTSEVGFQAMLGGLLHFFAVSDSFADVTFSAVDQNGSQSCSLREALPEAFTFSPLKAFDRLIERPSVGGLRSVRFIADRQVSFLFEAGKAGGDPVKVLTLDVYQQDRIRNSDALRRIGRYHVPLNGHVTELKATLVSASTPILLVATEGDSEIVLTDTIVLPAIFAPANAGMIEYHATLSSSASLMDVAAKISRCYVDHCARGLLCGGGLGSEHPRRQNTAVLLFVSDHYDDTAEEALEQFALVGNSVAWLGRDGRVTRSDGATIGIEPYLNELALPYVLLMDTRADLRPDFWAVIEKNQSMLGNAPELVTWDSIILDVMERPTVYRRTMLLHEAFAEHQLMDVHGCIASVELLRARVASVPGEFRSGRLRLNSVFAGAEKVRCAHMPVVIDTRRLAIPTVVMDRHLAEQVPTLTVPPEPGRRFLSSLSGVSVVVNFRDGVEQTRKCLSSIRAQDFDSAIEIILVNNGSLLGSVQAIGQHAVDLFGETAVKFIDYDAPFNHSAQTNLGARAASHELLFLVSNDAMLVSKNALEMACQVATVPWVATTGFRVVGKRDGKLRLQSMGLSLNPRSNLLIGASPVVSGNPPAFAQDRTIEAVGNTFAAVIVRRDVYFSLGGLDADVFPISYNDVDFCLRASSAGFRHIVVGAAVVDHVAHGSREIDLDLPIDQSIMDRMPSIARMSRIGFRSL
jgi:GT2 family glycosyltransferase